MRPYYPALESGQPWGYVWALTMPCQECEHRFPLIGSLVLRHPSAKRSDPGQSFRLVVDRGAGSFRAEVHDGPPTDRPTRVVPEGKSKYDAAGKSAICPFCGHGHSKDLQTRLAKLGLMHDAQLLAADFDDAVGKHFRALTEAEVVCAAAAIDALAVQPPFAPGLSAVPDEPIPPANTWTVQPLVYGAKTSAISATLDKPWAS